MRARVRELIARLLEAPLVIADDLAKLDAIIVLGAPLAAGDGLTSVLAERARAAAALFAAGGAPVVVVSGGVTRGRGRAEAAVLAEGIVEHGVPEAAVVVEDRSQTTAENARFCRAVLGERRRVWLVTQPFHGRRARWLFRRAGFEPRIWHIADSLEYRDRRSAMRWLTREYVAWLRALLPL